MEESRLHLAMIKFLGTIVLVLGAYIVMENLKADAEEPAVEESAARQLASVGPLTLEKSSSPGMAFSDGAIGTIDLKCLTELSEKITSTAKQIRIRGQICNSKSNRPSFTVAKLENVTTRIKASVFHTKDYQFTSDYVTLNKGENQFKISTQEEGGKLSESTFSIWFE